MSDTREISSELQAIKAALEGVRHKLDHMEERQWVQFYELVKLQALLGEAEHRKAKPRG